MRRGAWLYSILCLSFSLIGSFAQAQTCTSPSPQTTPPTVTCQAGQARTAAWDYTGDVQAGDVFKFYVNGAQVGSDIPAQRTTNISVQFGATLPAGSYTLKVSTARPGSGLAEAETQPLTLVLTAPPPPPPIAPSNLRVVEVIMRGKDQAGNVLWEQSTQMVVQAQ